MKYRLGDITVKHWNDWDRVPRDPFTIGPAIAAKLSVTSALGVGLITAGTYLAITAVTSWVLRALSPKPDFGASRGLLVNSREATAPQQIVYGEVRKGGTVTFIESTGTTNQYLHQIIVLAGHEVNSIGDIYVNDEVVTLDGNGFVTDAKWNSKIRIKKHTGADNQTADSDLVSETSVTSDFKGQGIAYLYVRMEYDQDVFAEGIPLFTAKVQGKKVYDPRTSTTGYSANAALCIRDYLVSGYGLDNLNYTDDSTNSHSFQVAANTCDESVSLSGGGTESRYEINGVITLDQKPSDILGDMMTACAGTLFWGQGEWHLKAGDYTSSVKTFTLDDLRGPISLDTKHSRRDNFNIVRGTFNDADQGYIRADYPEIRSTTFISDDNDIESAIDLALPLTTSSAMAQRLAKMTLYRAREQMTLSADFGLEAFEVECGDIIALTIDRYGWSAKEFEVVGWSFRNDGDAGDLRVGLTLRETSSAAFSWSAEETAITANNSTLPSPSDSLTPSSVTVTDTGVVQTDGSFVAQVKVAWTAGTNKFIDHHEVQWKVTGASDYASSQIEVGQNSIVLGPFEAGEQYNIRVRAVMTTGRRSPWVEATAHTVGGDTIAPSPVTGLSATGSIQSVTLDWTAPTTQVGGGTLYDLKGYYVYRSTSNSQPTDPVAFVSVDRFVDGGLSGSTTYYYWVKAVDFTGNDSTAVASGAVTTQSTPTSSTGATGASTNIIFIRATSASAPASSSGVPSGWSDTVPTGTDTLWASVGTKAVGASVFVWDTPFKAEGTSVVEVVVYRKNSSAGASGGSYNFTTQTLTAPTNWSQDAPSLTANGDVVYRISGIASGAPTQTAASITWSTAVVYARRVDGTDGVGTDGDTVATGRVYYQTLQSANPGNPSASGFNFSTGILTGLTSGWSQTQPAVDITDTSVYEWSAPFTATLSGGSTTVSFGTVTSAIQVTTDLESDNYVAGSTGWRIERDTGDAEFQNATIRGTLNADDIRTGTLTVNELPGLTFSDVVTGGDAGTSTSRFDTQSTADTTSAIRTALGFSTQTMYRYNNYASRTGVTSGSTLMGTATLTIEKNAGSDPSGMNTCYFVLYDGSTVVTSPCTNTTQTGAVTLQSNNHTATFTAALAIESAASGTATMGFYFSGGSPDENEMSADRYSFSVIEFTK